MSLKIVVRLAVIFGWMVFSKAGFAQSSARQIQEAIKNIESYQNKNPSQCKADLLQLLEKNPSAPDTCKANIYMDVAITFGMLNQVDSGLWAINKTLTYVTDKDFLKINALRTKAILHRLKGEYPQAKLAISACLQLNDSIWKNQPFKAIALQEYASLCNDQNNFYQATKLYLQALDVVNSTNSKDEKSPFIALKIQ
jgi:tetratricopeptide (TPR) repeat protein